ncbi:MAG: hypothetical protein ACOCZL_05475 [Bacteroidota bacterium]
MPNKKTLLNLLLVLITLPAVSQVNTHSPYSRFGLGEISMPGFTQNRSL